MAVQAPETCSGDRRVPVCFDGDGVAEGNIEDLDLDRAHFMRHDAPLIDLLSELRRLRVLRGRGQISDVKYERLRSQVLNRI